MVQEFNVLKCFACNTFQVHQVKKTTKQWSCKMCGEKQSIKQVFFTGSGKDCRMHVQTLNFQYKDQNRNACKRDTSFKTVICVQDDDTKSENSCYSLEGLVEKQPEHNSRINRWEMFIERQPEIENHEEQFFTNVTTDRDHFQGTHKKTRQKNLKINREGVKPYSYKSPRQCERLNAALRNKTSIKASSPIQNIKNTVDHDNSCSIQSTEVRQLNIHESQSYKMVSRWGKFLTSSVDDDTSQPEGDGIQ